MLYAPIGSGGTYDMSLYYQKYNFYSNIKYEYLSTATVSAVAIPGSSGYDLTANFSAAVLTASQSITISLGANEVITGL